MPKSDTFDGPMFLVYVDSNNERHFQPWQDLPEAGVLIDENGDDMELVGWCIEK